MDQRFFTGFSSPIEDEAHRLRSAFDATLQEQIEKDVQQAIVYEEMPGSPLDGIMDAELQARYGEFPGFQLDDVVNSILPPIQYPVSDHSGSRNSPPASVSGCSDLFSEPALTEDAGDQHSYFEDSCVGDLFPSVAIHRYPTSEDNSHSSQYTNQQYDCCSPLDLLRRFDETDEHVVEDSDTDTIQEHDCFSPSLAPTYDDDNDYVIDNEVDRDTSIAPVNDDDDGDDADPDEDPADTEARILEKLTSSLHPKAKLYEYCLQKPVEHIIRPNPILLPRKMTCPDVVLKKPLSLHALDMPEVIIPDVEAYAVRGREERGFPPKRPLNGFIYYYKAYKEIAKKLLHEKYRVNGQLFVGTLGRLMGKSWVMEAPQLRTRFLYFAELDAERVKELYPDHVFEWNGKARFFKM